MPDLSIVLPCYNEAGNLPFIFERMKKALANAPDTEIVFVNNGSTDNSKDIFEKELAQNSMPGARLVTVPVNRGYGYGIMTGLRATRGRILAWTHADMQTDPMDVIDGYRKFISSPDEKLFLKGRRIHRGLFDVIFTAGMSATASILLGAGLSDINAQPKMFNRSFLDLMQNPPDDFSLDLYVLYIARKNGLKIIEQPVSFEKRRHGSAKGGGSIAGKISLSKRTFAYIWKLRKDICKH